MRVLILNNSVGENDYDSVDQWSRHLTLPFDVYHASANEFPTDISIYTHIISTGSAVSVSAEVEWMKTQAALLREAASLGKVILGSCFGHQLLAAALFGSDKVREAKVPELGWYRIQASKTDCIFSGLENSFHCFCCHFDEVHNLPADKVETFAFSENCAVQAYKIKNKPIWGVQAHPEMNIEESFILLNQVANTEGPRQANFKAALDSTPQDSEIIAKLMKNFQRAKPL